MNFLDRILEHKRQEVAALKTSHPLEDVKSRAGDADAPRGFAARLARDAGPVALIAEVKKASPSRGVIAGPFDPARIAGAYEEGGASCLSVLTDANFFQGSLLDLKAARKATSLPALRKDFVIDEYQVYESRAAGADCILLIVAAFPGESSRLYDLLALAAESGMDALVETHTEAEMAAAAEAGAKLIGINNRDLSTFETDLAVTERLAPLAPPDALVVSESGITSRAEVERAAEAGAKAVLVGESLMRTESVRSAVRELLGR
ncbi:MAG: indole-3-glycerol phosphate synthase TrpC [Armatimonadetes bacterium]|nr:indole-3-glycerol phosphate synthase TrpC [Armatimonadota bacterium]